LESDLLTIPALYTSRTLSRMLALYDPQSTGTWLGNNPEADTRWMREDIYLVVALMERRAPGDLELARTILRHICQSQHREPGDFADGQFLYSPVTYPAPDQSTTQFILPVLLWILDTRSHLLDAETIAQAEDAARRAIGFKKRYYGPLSNLSDFTNFQALAIASLTMGGTRFADPEAIEIARRQLDLLWNRLSTTGFSAEFQSPTYVAVTSWACSLLLNSAAADADIRAKVRLLQQRFGLEAALAVHPEFSQVAGPYSRTFADGLFGGATLTSLMIAVETSDIRWAQSGRIGPVYEANHSLDINPSAMMAILGPAWDDSIRALAMGRSLPTEIHHRHLGTRRATTWLAPDISLGTLVSRSNAQNEGIVIQVAAPENPGGIAVAVMRAQAGDLPEITSLSVDPTLFRQSAVQAGPRALLVQRRQLAQSAPPVGRLCAGLIFEERFGQWTELRIQGVPVDLRLGEQVEFASGRWLTLRRRNAYVALRGLAVRGPGEITTPGAVKRSDRGLQAFLHALDQQSAIPAANSVGEWLWAVEVGSLGQNSESYDQFVHRVLSMDPPRGDFGTTTVFAQWDRVTGGPRIPGPPVLLASWNRTTLERTVDRRIGKDWLAADDLVSAPDLSMPGPSAQGRAQLANFQCQGLHPGAWIVRPHGTDQVTAFNPTSATMTLIHNWSDSELMIPPWQWRTVTRDIPEPTAAADWDLFR
jgi:hypothetical protein